MSSGSVLRCNRRGNFFHLQRVDSFPRGLFFIFQMIRKRNEKLMVKMNLGIAKNYEWSVHTLKNLIR